MSPFQFLAPEQARSFLDEILGSAVDQPAGIAELIRGEVSARGCSTRTATIRRVCRLVAPVSPIGEDSIAEVIDLLEREGDLVLGNHGVLSATPLRAIDLGDGVFRFVCSLSTRRLAVGVKGEWEISGVRRNCRVLSVDKAKEAVGKAGGGVLKPEEWACLSRTPRADRSWLDALDRRLLERPEPPRSLEKEYSLEWRGLLVSAGGWQWKKIEAGSTAQLWRARSRWGYWLYAWTSGSGDPSASPFVALRTDDGIRSSFAVASVAAVPLTAYLEKRADESIVTISAWLPLAEYRFLSVSASAFSRDHEASRWALPQSRVASVCGKLSTQLGLVVKEGTYR